MNSTVPTPRPATPPRAHARTCSHLYTLTHARPLAHAHMHTFTHAHTHTCSHMLSPYTHILNAHVPMHVCVLGPNISHTPLPPHAPLPAPTHLSPPHAHTHTAPPPRPKPQPLAISPGARALREVWAAEWPAGTSMCCRLMCSDGLTVGSFLLYIYSNKIMQQYPVCSFLWVQPSGLWLFPDPEFCHWVVGGGSHTLAAPWPLPGFLPGQ